MRVRTVLLLLCLWTAGTPVSADTVSDVDSLLRIYDRSQGDKHLSVGRQLLQIYGSSSVFFNDVPAISADMNRKEQDLTVWFGTERFYTTNSYYAEALEYNEKCTGSLASNPSSEGEGSHAHDFLPTLLCDKAYCLFKRSDYMQSIEVCQQAIRQCQQTDDKLQLSRAYLYLSMVNHSLQKHDEAMALVEKAIDTNRKIGINMQTHNTLGVACEIFCSAKEVDQAIEYGRQAVEAARAIDYIPGVANHLTQLSYAYDRKGEYALGLLMADSAIAMVRATDPLDRNQLALSLEFKGWNLIDLGRQREAADALREAIDLQQELGNSHAAWIDYRTLAEALEAYDPNASIGALRKYISMGDSIHSEQLKELMSQANAEFHNDELKEENAESRRMNRIILWTAIAVVALLTLAIASLWFAFRQKKRTAEMVQRLADTREEFFTNVTHELRTPLTVILGLAKELKSPTPAPHPTLSNANETGNEAEIGHTIERQARHLLTLVNQMLDISKVKTALGEQPRTRGNIAAYVGMLVERYREMALQKGVTVEYDTDEQPIETDFVADYTEKMVGNLLTNAIKYTPEGGHVLTSLHYHDGILRLIVSDTGKGIEQKDLPHIFEPFYSTGNADSPGTGVGLALVKQIVDTLGGKIGVESKPGHTTFSVDLPATVFETHKSRERQLSQPTLLIVEDNADVAALIGRQLVRGYTLCFATDGEEGIAKARDLMPDLIITDLMMPGTNGLQLCRAIRSDEATNHIPIIVVTAKATEKDRIEGRKAGADEYLFKPFNAEELNVCVESLLEQRERLRQKFKTPALTAPRGGLPHTVTVNAGAGPLPAGDYPFADPSEDFIENMKKAIRELMANRDSSVEQVASKMCVTPYQLRTKLMAVTGATPKKFILNARLEFARQMLSKTPGRTISDVAECCGFYDKSHFIRAFRDAFDMTPNDYVKSLHTS